MAIAGEPPEVKRIPYRRSDGTSRVATIVPVGFSTFSENAFSQEELRVLDHLAKAAEGMTPIYAQQEDHRTLDLLRELKRLEATVITSEQKKALDDYITLLQIRNSPFDALGNSYPLQLPKRVFSNDHAIHAFDSILFDSEPAPPTAGIYPRDITEAEFAQLGDSGMIENSTVRRSLDGKLQVVLNEQRFGKELLPVIKDLEAAAAATTTPALRNYLRKKAVELRTGTNRARTRSDIAWLSNSGDIDLVLGTAVETYSDRFKGVRSSAYGCVFVTNPKYTEIADKLLALMPEFEAAAPWKHKKNPGSNDKPRLQFVDAVTMAGGYEPFPFVIYAESLPNNREVSDRHGSVNMVFVNVKEAMAMSGLDELMQKEFVPKEGQRNAKDMLFLELIMGALHEIGHKLGATVNNDQLTKLFGSSEHVIEEARADVFSAWALQYIAAKGIITKAQELTGYYALLTMLIRDMQSEPVAHSGARNIMFNYFRKDGGIIETAEDGTTKFSVNPAKLHLSASKLLRELSDIRACYNAERFEKLRAKYTSQAEQAVFGQSIDQMPTGIGLIFPQLERTGQRYTGRLVYPQTFRGQPRTLEHFI